MIATNLQKIKENLNKDVQLVVVTKKQTFLDIKKVYSLGYRTFGENRVQDLLEIKDKLPEDINWHFIGHLQRNKIKYIAPFISLIHAVDNEKLLQEINKQAAKFERIIPVLLQMHIATEQSKFGMNKHGLFDLVSKIKEGLFPNIRIDGLMGMATNTTDKEQVKSEFLQLKRVFDELKKEINTLKILSMGMTNDYTIAQECGSTMVRIGSGVFAKNEL